MCGFVVRLLAGAYALTFVSTLPPLYVLLIIFVIGAVFATAWRTKSAVPLLGLAWFGIAAWAALADRLNPSLAGETIAMEARVAGFPEREGAMLRFIAIPADQSLLPDRVRLSWRDPATEPVIGERWRFEVRLKRPRGYVNPAGFDYALWLLRERIGATGFVVDGHRLDSENESLTIRARRRVVSRIDALLPADDASAVLMALTVGARHRISRESWDRFAVTGTSHLMAISGLHVGLAAASAYFVCRLFIAAFWRRGNHRDMALIPAALLALLYATLTGFGVPAQRACLMIGLTVAYLWRRRRPPLHDILAMSALLVFLTNPLALLAPGFQLSFAAVAVLACAALPVMRALPAGINELLSRAVTNVGRLGRLQLFLLFGLFPLTVLQFGRYSVLAPVINLLVLPVFSVAVVPLALAGAVLGGPAAAFGDTLLRSAYHLLRLVLQLLELGAAIPLPQQTAALSAPVTIIAFVTLLYVCLPTGWPGRKLAVLALVFVASWRPPAPQHGCFEYTVLDVGQGLAVLVQTEQHALLFDTGPAFPDGANIATLVVEPFLLRRGIERLDTLLISHSDNDHAGGVQELAERFLPVTIVSGDPAALPVPASACVAGHRWRWDDVGFDILHPPARSRWHGNNVSCVLRVSAGRHRLLIAGDIETPVERLLVKRHEELAGDIVVVPHHGSATSSSQAFVDASGASIAIVSTSFGNRWGFPAAAVAARWANAGAVMINTADSGAIGQQLCGDRPGSAIRRERIVAKRWWQDAVSLSP